MLKMFAQSILSNSQNHSQLFWPSALNEFNLLWNRLSFTVTPYFLTELKNVYEKDHMH